jgi:hypothetical protein
MVFVYFLPSQKVKAPPARGELEVINSNKLFRSLGQPFYDFQEYNLCNCNLFEEDLLRILQQIIEKNDASF